MIHRFFVSFSPLFVRSSINSYSSFLLHGTGVTEFYRTSLSFLFLFFFSSLFIIYIFCSKLVHIIQTIPPHPFFSLKSPIILKLLSSLYHAIFSGEEIYLINMN